MTLNPSQLSRLNLIVKVLGRLYQKEALRLQMGISNKMVFTRWSKGEVVPSEDEAREVCRFAEPVIMAQPMVDWLGKGGLWPWVKAAWNDDDISTGLNRFLEKSPLAQLREQHGLAQDEAAKLIGCSRATLIKHEKTEALAEGEFYEKAKRAYERRS